MKQTKIEMNENVFNSRTPDYAPKHQPISADFPNQIFRLRRNIFIKSEIYHEICYKSRKYLRIQSTAVIHDIVNGH